MRKNQRAWRFLPVFLSRLPTEKPAKTRVYKSYAKTRWKRGRALNLVNLDFIRYSPGDRERNVRAFFASDSTSKGRKKRPVHGRQRGWGWKQANGTAGIIIYLFGRYRLVRELESPLSSLFSREPAWFFSLFSLYPSKDLLWDTMINATCAFSFSLSHLRILLSSAAALL